MLRHKQNFGKKNILFDFKFKNRFAQTKIFEDLKNKKEDFWLNLIEKYILKAYYVSIVGKPSEELMKSIAEQDKERVEERKRKLGKKGLKELQQIVDNAQAQNDVNFIDIIFPQCLVVIGLIVIRILSFPTKCTTT
jgi:hypothetical protein